MFVVILNPIKLPGVLSVNLEYDKKMTSGNEDERVLFLASLISNGSGEAGGVYCCQSCGFRSVWEGPSDLVTDERGDESRAGMELEAPSVCQALPQAQPAVPGHSLQGMVTAGRPCFGQMCPGGDPALFPEHPELLPCLPAPVSSPGTGNSHVFSWQ